MKKLAVIGVGTAGIQSLCHFLTYLNGSEFEVYSISDPSIPILGIGESTNPSFIQSIELATNFSFYSDLNNLNGTYKLGSYYRNWRKHDFINPFLYGSLSVHFDTNEFHTFAIPRLQQKWGSKFNLIHGKVTELKNIDEGVLVGIDDKNYYFFDYVIDCSGFPNNFDDYDNADIDTVNKCFVFDDFSKKNEQWNYTLHQATPDGWMFGIPLQKRTSYGYLFDSTITSETRALNNFSEIINHEVSSSNVRTYSFRSYKAKRINDGRIFKNGNKIAFFEPLFGNSQQFYFNTNLRIFNMINSDMCRDVIEDQNKQHLDNLKLVEGIINYTYHGGSVFDTDFWKKVVVKSKNSLYDNSFFIEAIKDSKEGITNNYHSGNMNFIFEEHALRLIDSDTHFGYNYFNGNGHVHI